MGRLIAVLVPIVVIMTALSFFYRFWRTEDSMFLVIGTLILLIYWGSILFFGRISFWRLASQHPLPSLVFLQNDPRVYFDQRPKNVKTSGPFKLEYGNTTYTFFIDEEQIETVQDELAAILKGLNGK